MHFSKKCDTIPYDLIAYYAILEKRKDILVKMIGEYILLALLLISAIFIVTAVTIQKTSDEGLSGTIAGGSETYYGKDKAKQSGKLLNKWTLIVAAVFALVVVVVYIMQPDYTTMIAAPGGWKELGGFEFTSVFK